MHDQLIHIDELKKYGPVKNLSEQARTLLLHQRETWSLAKNNYSGLKAVKERLIHFGDFKIRLQFNPERIRSSAAKTDQKSISERPCFLCEKNLPSAQKGIDFNGKYTILINPFPIFLCHLTIPLNEHKPQQIAGRFKEMLQLSKALDEFTIFYNGPKCGASAPDHFHFQAGLKGLMPVNAEAKRIAHRYGETLLEDEKLKMIAVDTRYSRKFIFLESNDIDELEKQFNKIYHLLPLRENETEPMMNILCSFKDDWEMVIFPREKQRPWQFFEQGTDQILMSPASAEMGGLAILPREKDFENIAANDLRSIFKQVTLSDKAFEKLKEELNQTKDE